MRRDRKLCPGDSPALHYTGRLHGHLPAAQSVLDEIDGVLTSTPVEHYAAGLPIGVTAADVVLAGEQLHVTAECPDHTALLDAEVLTDPGGTRIARGTLQVTAGFTRTIVFESIPPGGYRLSRTAECPYEDVKQSEFCKAPGAAYQQVIVGAEAGGEPVEVRGAIDEV